MKRTRVPLDTYLKSTEYNYFETLNKYFINSRHLNVEDIYDLIRIQYNKSIITFSAYNLMDDEVYTDFIKWRNTLSTKHLYFEQVRKSFIFIQNYCINNNVSFEKYILTRAKKHIREEKIDFAVAQYLKLVDKRTINKIEKITLKKYLSQYNIIKIRLSNPELSTLLSHLFQEMKTLLQHLTLWKELVTTSN
jgi:hypothetical protein